MPWPFYLREKGHPIPDMRLGGSQAISNSVETGRAPHILNLDTRCSQLHVIATLPHGDSTHYPLGRWVGPRVSHDIVEKKYLIPAKSENPVPQLSNHSPVNVSCVLSWDLFLK
jgi:hypothetical protein